MFGIGQAQAYVAAKVKAPAQTDMLSKAFSFAHIRRDFWIPSELYYKELRSDMIPINLYSDKIMNIFLIYNCSLAD